MLNVRPVSVLNFFEVTTNIYRYVSSKKLLDKKYLLPSFSKFLNEESFAELFMAYDEGGLYFHVKVNVPFTKVNSPEFNKADSIEIFIDTKDLKTKGHITKFCHHFVFFPEKVQNSFGKEISRFRADDMHKLCNTSDLKIEASILKDSYFMNIFIPQSCLHGFDLKNNDKIGFNYRINRYSQESMHFCASSKEYPIERNPYLWATLALKE